MSLILRLLTSLARRPPPSATLNAARHFRPGLWSRFQNHCNFLSAQYDGYFLGRSLITHMPLHPRSRICGRIEETQYRQTIVISRRADTSILHIKLESTKLFRCRRSCPKKRVPPLTAHKYIVYVLSIKPFMRISSRKRRRSADTGWLDIRISCR